MRPTNTYAVTLMKQRKGSTCCANLSAKLRRITNFRLHLTETNHKERPWHPRSIRKAHPQQGCVFNLFVLNQREGHSPKTWTCILVPTPDWLYSVSKIIPATNSMPLQFASSRPFQPSLHPCWSQPPICPKCISWRLSCQARSSRVPLYPCSDQKSRNHPSSAPNNPK